MARGRVHKVPITTRSKIIARRVAAGETVENLAKEYGIKVATVRCYLYQGRKESNL